MSWPYMLPIDAAQYHIQHLVEEYLPTIGQGDQPQSLEWSAYDVLSQQPCTQHWPPQGDVTTSPTWRSPSAADNSYAEDGAERIRRSSIATTMLGSSSVCSSSNASPYIQPSTISTTSPNGIQIRWEQDLLSDQDLSAWGVKNDDGTWSCSHPGCTSRSTFSRGCDLRKHYKQHLKRLKCRFAGCEFAVKDSFSSRKDRDRHEAKHCPKISCSEGCGKVFSRADNMRDHVRRIHRGKRR